MREKTNKVVKKFLAEVKSQAKSSLKIKSLQTRTLL